VGIALKIRVFFRKNMVFNAQKSPKCLTNGEIRGIIHLPGTGWQKRKNPPFPETNEVNGIPEVLIYEQEDDGYVLSPQRIFRGQR
jgi:hypothetical protein